MRAPLTLVRADFEDGGESYQVILRGAPSRRGSAAAAHLGRVSQMHDGQWIAGHLPERYPSRDAAVVALLTTPDRLPLLTPDGAVARRV